MKVLVTGGAGFIGSHIVDSFCSAGADVIVVDSLDPEVFHAPPAYLNAKADYFFADLRRFEPDDRFDDVQMVVHCAALGGVSRAARQRENVLTANAGGTARLLDVATRWKRLRRVVLCSSFSVYGSNYGYRCEKCGTVRNAERRDADLVAGRFEVLCAKCEAPAGIVAITEEATPSPLEAYGASKFMQELCFRSWTHAPYTILRFSSVYGERLRLDDGEATIIAKIAGWIRDGQRPRLFEDGRQIRDWVHVADIVGVVQKLAGGVDAPPVVNVCSGVPTTLIQACEAIARAMNKDCPPDVVGGYRPGDMRHCLGDPAKVKRVLGRDVLPFSKGAMLAFGRS